MDLLTSLLRIRIRDRVPFWPRILHGKNLDLGSKIKKIPDPQHWFFYQWYAFLDLDSAAIKLKNTVSHKLTWSETSRKIFSLFGI